MGFSWRLARLTSPMTRPLAGRRFFPLWAVVHHRGRRSGQAYATPVAARATSEAFVISLPWGTETQWARNVLAAGGCVVRWKGADHAVSGPEIVDPDEALPAFNPVQRALLRAAAVRTFLRLRRA